MLHVELPHVNVLSKMDLMEQYGKLGKLIRVSFKQILQAVVRDYLMNHIDLCWINVLRQ